MEELHAGDAEQVSHFLFVQLSTCGGKVGDDLFGHSDNFENDHLLPIKLFYFVRKSTGPIVAPWKCDVPKTGRRVL